MEDSDVPYVRAVDLFAVAVQGLWDPDDTSEEDLLETVIREMDDPSARRCTWSWSTTYDVH